MPVLLSYVARYQNIPIASCCRFAVVRRVPYVYAAFHQFSPCIKLHQLLLQHISSTVIPCIGLRLFTYITGVCCKQTDHIDRNATAKTLWTLKQVCVYLLLQLHSFCYVSCSFCANVIPVTSTLSWLLLNLHC